MTTIVDAAEPTTREDLQDIVYDASARITPFLNVVPVGDASATYHEWPVDEYETADSDQAQPEAKDTASSTIAPRIRPGNYLQINDRTPRSSGTINAVDIAGVAREQDYQVIRAGTNVMKDIEAAALSNNEAAASGAGPGANARQMAGLESWLFTNAIHEGTGSTPDWTGNTPTSPTTAPTDGTPRPFTEELFQDCLQSIYENSDSMPTHIFLPPKQKRELSNFDATSTGSFAGNQVNWTGENARQGTLLRGIEYYVSDWWPEALIAVPTRHIRGDAGDTQDTVFVVDPEYVEMVYLRRLREEQLAKTGDYDTTLVIAESTLCVKDEKAHGKVADLSK